MGIAQKKRRRRTIVLVALLSYVGIMTFGGCADRVILWPPRGQRDPGPAVQRTLTVEGKRLDIWIARSPTVVNDHPDAFVLEFCGNATRAEEITQYVADRWRHHAVEAWVMNYPGYGASEGGAHLKLIPPAALATYDDLAKVANGRPIYLAGNSLGTTTALYVAAHRPTAGMVLQNPPPLQKLVIGHYGWWNLWILAGPISWQIPSELNSLINAPLVHAPAVFLSADADTTVPPPYHKMVIDAYAGPKRVIVMHAGHNNSVIGDAEANLLHDIDWLFQQRGTEVGSTEPAR